MNKLTILILSFLVGFTAFGQTDWKKKGLKVPPPICYASDEVVKTFIPPPPEILNRLKSGAEKKSDIVVSYSLFPENARLAFDYAVSIWEEIIESPVPIYLQANWRTKDKNVLGSCGPAGYYQNFEGAPRANRFYPVVVAEKITKKEITGSWSPDIEAEFNKTINWYFGTNGNTPDSLYDFVSVVLHEIGHGLGFVGFFFVEGENGSYGYYSHGDISAFDLLVAKNNNDLLINTSLFGNPSKELKSALISGLLYADSPVATIAGKGFKPRLYAPAIWDDGSSIYHLNDATYPGGSANSLMTHSIGKGEAIHDPGPITKGIMADIGWKNMFIDFKKLKDIEEIKPLSYNVKIESDYELDSASLFVVFSVDSFKTHIDSLLLKAGSEPNMFSAEIVPALLPGTIHYYIKARDKKNRTFTHPNSVPDSLHSVTIGPDNKAPEIEHVPISYFLKVGQTLEVSAIVNDNLGVDTVVIEYEINELAQATFGLTNDSANVYSGVFNFGNYALKDGDVVTYKVIAKDASVAQNIARVPFKDKFRFNIEEIFEPIGGYINNFDNLTSDFIISDFKIFTETGFFNGALHSSHPYISPNKDDTYLNFSTILKRPIILRENGTMSFDEIVLVEPGDPGTLFGDENFWDYVIVEGSKNIGKTWLPLADGYDSKVNATWLTNYNLNIVKQFSSAVGIPQWYVNREIKLLQNNNFSKGDTILVRFRLHSDPYASGWGWAVDNLRIQTPVTTPLTVLSPGNINVFPNPFTNVFNISLEVKNSVEEIQLDVFNMYGQKIKSALLKNSFGRVNEEIDLKDSGSGMYFVSVKENGRQVYSGKIIKK